MGLGDLPNSETFFLCLYFYIRETLWRGSYTNSYNCWKSLILNERLQRLKRNVLTETLQLFIDRLYKEDDTKAMNTRNSPLFSHLIFWVLPSRVCKDLKLKCINKSSIVVSCKIDVHIYVHKSSGRISVLGDCKASLYQIKSVLNSFLFRYCSYIYIFNLIVF